mmetsp:Transcript_3565/g.12783  ORF Transcript_3565/g.12783 Transcript_3565/m.12783 type:complete len:164 (+) Transcript_3565:161-652(+)
MTTPFSSTTTWSASLTVWRRWAMTRHVRPGPSPESAFCTSRSEVESSADVASSRINTGASLRSARAMATLWRCPPERSAPPGPSGVSNFSGRSSANPLTLAASAAACTSADVADSEPILMLSATVMVKSAGDWETTPTFSRRRFKGKERASLPPKRICPDSTS